MPDENSLLQEAWRRINAMRQTGVAGALGRSMGAFDRGFDRAIEQSLSVIEELSGHRPNDPTSGYSA